MTVTSQFVANLRRIVETEVLLKMTQLLAECHLEAPRVVASWGEPRRKGGLPYNTYRAVCRNEWVSVRSAVGAVSEG